MNIISHPQRKKELPVKKLIEEKKKAWSLSLLSPAKSIRTKLLGPDLHRPGLALSGFVEKFSWERVQILGETEWTYLDSLGAKGRKRALDIYFSFAIPCIILTKSLIAHTELLQAAESKGVPILSTSMSTVDMMDALCRYLAGYFALQMTLHGSLVDVYGVGMLYTGRPGIGKSECCLDLVERGHRLVADDVVHVARVGDSLIGSGNKLIQNHMEIRGMGIIDVRQLFGVRAVRKEKKVEVLVELIDWASDLDYERIGVDDCTTEILELPVQKVVIPVSPGKNITVISEVVAMNMLLKLSGINAAKLFNRRLIQTMERKRKERLTDVNTIE